jgi:hypothetical protein
LPSTTCLEAGSAFNFTRQAIIQSGTFNTDFLPKALHMGVLQVCLIGYAFSNQQTFATFDEFVSLLRVKFFKTLPKIPASDADLFYSYYLLTGTSRSFAVVIQELPFELRDPVSQIVLLTHSHRFAFFI